MVQRLEVESVAEEIYLAGEKVTRGTYRQVGCTREIRIVSEDFLPASFDGRVACYLRIRETWAQMSNNRPVA